MIRLNVHEAKTHLSRYLDQLEAGEVIVLCRRNQPIAEIRGLPKPATGTRPVGKFAHLFSLPSSFFDPLPEEFLQEFGA
jgi:antitoxin (DNA-binding transcriptional repressor) of toxin-antitoxin stability system